MAARHPSPGPRPGDARQADAGQRGHQRPPRAGPPDRRPRPAGGQGAAHARRAGPGDLRPHHLGPGPGVPHRRTSAATATACRWARSCASCATPTAAASASSTCTSRSRRRSAGSRSTSRGSTATSRAEEHRHILERLNAAEAFEQFLGKRYVGQKRFGLDGAESAIPARRRRARGGGRGGPGRRGAGHGPPGPAQRADQRRGQVLRPALRRVRGLDRPRDHPGLRRREVPPRPVGQVREPQRRRAAHRAGGQPVPPRGRRPGRARHGAGPPGPDRPAGDLLGPAPAAARRRRVRRAGRRGRDAAEQPDLGLPGRRHDPPGHQQPARLHHAARVGPLVGVPDRHRQDGRLADHPRERRRSRGLRAGRPAGLRLPAAVPQGRRDRHDLLPPVRPQRGRRPVATRSR